MEVTPQQPVGARREANCHPYGALFGIFAYATFDLTALSVLKTWTWLVAFVDVAWGSFVTAVSAAAGLAAANWLAKAA